MTIRPDEKPVRRAPVVVPGGAILMDEERTLSRDELLLLRMRCQGALDALEFYEALETGLVL